MIAPERSDRTALEPLKLSEPIAAVELDEEPNPAQVLADLYRRCGRGGGCPYSLDQLLSVLRALRYHGKAEAGELAKDAELPASATYGCLLETEDFGFSRWIARPVHLADHQTAEITLTGLRFLRETQDRGGRNV